MTRPAASDGYMRADEAAALLGVDISRVYQLSKSEEWGRKREGRGRAWFWAYVADDVRETERKRRG